MSPPNQDNIDDQPAYDREVALRAHAVVVSRSQASRSFSRASHPYRQAPKGSGRIHEIKDDGHRMMVRNELPPFF
jgi:hypothetical protein